MDGEVTRLGRRVAEMLEERGRRSGLVAWMIVGPRMCAVTGVKTSEAE